MNELSNIMTIEGVECYEENGTAYLKLETVARGLGFTETKGGKEYVKWRRVGEYLKQLGFATSGERFGEIGIATSCDGGYLPEFIPENIFYRLAMKAKNEAAERFQAKIADEVIPSIRRHGAYMTPETLERALLSPDFLLRLAQKLKEEQEGRLAAELDRNYLAHELAVQQPKIDYFDALVDANLLTSLRETAKLLHVKEKTFVQYLLDNRFLYRGQNGKLLPYATLPANTLFEVKEAYDPKSGWRGVQTYVTPRGRETFRMLLTEGRQSRAWAPPLERPREMTAGEACQCEAFFRKEAALNQKKHRKKDKAAPAPVSRD